MSASKYSEVYIIIYKCNWHLNLSHVYQLQMDLTSKTRSKRAQKNFVVRPPLKKSLFSVQRVAIIVASREAAKSFFPPLYRNGRKNAGKKKKNREIWKKCAYLALIGSPGQWTGNKIIFKGGITLKDPRLRPVPNKACTELLLRVVNARFWFITHNIKQGYWVLPLGMTSTQRHNLEPSDISRLMGYDHLSHTPPWDLQIEVTFFLSRSKWLT